MAAEYWMMNDAGKRPEHSDNNDPDYPLPKFVLIWHGERWQISNTSLRLLPEYSQESLCESLIDV